MEFERLEPVRLRTMSRRIDIELTSAQGDGSWTWRAAGAKVPKGVLDGSILPEGAAVGDELKVEIRQEIDGIVVLGVVQGRTKVERADRLELLVSDEPFEPVVQQRAESGGRGRPARSGRRSRRDRDSSEGGETRGDDRSTRDDRSQRRPRRRSDDEGAGDRRARTRPSFTPPPEVPQRPKPKRLRPGRTRRTEVLAGLPEEQRPVAELTLQGMAAVRQRLREENQRLEAEGKPPMPEASVLKLAEELLPRLRVAEWLDRAEAALRQLDSLDLRDLRSVVAAGDDPIVARDESTRSVAAELKAALAAKQEHELQLWLSDIDTALSVGRVVRALRLSSQPPKAGVPFPADLAQRLAGGAAGSLTSADPPDRWIAVLEAAAFSPVRTAIMPQSAPEQVTDDLRATVTRLAPALPQIASLFGVDVAPDAPMPKPLRPVPRPKAAPSRARSSAPTE